MPLDLATVAREFALSEDDLTREGIRAFLAEQLRLLDAERRARCAKYGVSTLAEMDGLIRRGEVEEDDILEDFQEVDYLYDRIERVRTMLEES